MNKRFVRQALEEYATRHMPPSPDLWPAIRRQVRLAAPAPRRFPISNLGRVVLPTALLLGLVVVALALGVGLLRGGAGGSSRVSIPGTGTPEEPPLTPTVLVKTVHGYTIKMQPLWADANRITLRYAVIGSRGADQSWVRILPDDPNMVGPTPQLTDDQGQQFPWLATRSNFDFAPAEDQTPAADKVVVQWLSVDFDATGLSGSPAQISLHLTLAPLIFSPATPTGATVLPTLLSTTFDFRMPFEGARRVVEVGQTAMVSGVGMALERVVVSRYETRAILHVLPPARGTIRTATLGGANWTSRNPPTRSRNPTIVECLQLPEGRQACSFYMALLDQEGEWTLNVQGLNGKPSERTMGTWTFRFIIPPVAP